MRKKIRTPVIDECRLEGMLQEISGLDALTISHDAKILLPDDSTIDQELAILHGLVDSHDASAVRGRMLIGNFVKGLSFRHGDKAQMIEASFSRQGYNRIRKFARVAKAWGWNPGLTWGWSFYDETAKLDREQQLKVIAKWQMGKYTIEAYRADKEFNPISNCPTSDNLKPIDSPNPTHGSNTKYIGFGTLSDIEQAIRSVPTKTDALRLQQIVDQRVLDFDQDDRDDFAEEED